MYLLVTVLSFEVSSPGFAQSGLAKAFNVTTGRRHKWRTYSSSSPRITLIQFLVEAIMSCHDIDVSLI